jgi:hypothetical protein
MHNWWYVATRDFACAVETDGVGNIVMTPPILRRFQGQRLADLALWIATKHGGGIWPLDAS